MSVRQQRFIKALKQALAAVERGDTGCQQAPRKCWACAMRYRTGAFGKTRSFKLVHPNGAQLTSEEPSYWSFNRPKSDTIAMFRNSIAAMEQ